MPAHGPRLRLPQWSIALTLLAAPALAQWSPKPSNVTPPARRGAVLTWQRDIHAAVLFGGVDAANAVLGDTWLHDGIGWRQLQVGGPSARRYAACAEDPSRRRLLLFGGEAGSNQFADTWAFDGVQWQQLQLATAPPARSGAAMAYDARRDRIVLHGGSANGSVLADNWEFDGAQWNEVATATQPALAFAACTFDALRAQVVLTGGSDGITDQNITWSYDGGDWRQLDANQVRPAPRHGAVLVADADRGVLTLNGGLSPNSTPFADTWEFDGVAWTQLPSGGPSARGLAAMTFDGDRLRGLLFGGTAGGSETWVFAANPRAFAAPFGPSCDGRTLDRVGLSLPEIGSTFALDLDGAGSTSLVIGALGTQSTSSSGTPLPVPNVACRQLTNIVAPMLLGQAGPVFRWALPIPANVALQGQQYYLQAFELEAVAAGLLAHTSNAVEFRIGSTPLERRVTEDFTTSLRRDAQASAGNWGGGALGMGLIGGDGHHGSFDATIGTPVGGNVYEFDTDAQRIPGRLTLIGQAETVTDGRFYFTDFVLPAGTTLRFVGSNPARVFVRGRVDIAGRIELNAAAMTTFTSYSGAQATPIAGQPGGQPGAGGARGGRGGDRCLGVGPSPDFNGHQGEDVRLPAGHAYASRAIGTGGQGSAMFPSAGLMTSVLATFQIVYTGQCAPGGAGGGSWTSGAAGTANTTLPAIVAGPAPVPGVAFNAFPVPAAASSLDHFLIGGSGGGGGGSHPLYGISISGQGMPDSWKAGAGGSGGGGAMAIRSGGDLTIVNTAALEARGGAGVNFPSRVIPGNACPGGGGSGGSFLLQSGTQVTMAGLVDTSGGPGSRIENVNPANASIMGLLVQGGAGAAGSLRFESPLPPSLTGTSVPPLDPARQIGALTDRDASSGSRSLFVALPGANANVTHCDRYELDVEVNGVPLRFSDDPAFGLPASDPLGPVVARFQAGRNTGAGVEPVGQWRRSFGRDGGSFDDVNLDLPTHARFDLTLNNVAGTVVVRALRLYCR